MHQIIKAWLALRTWLIALLPIVPAVAAVTSVLLFLADWPDKGNRDYQLVVALGIAAATWVLASILFGPEVTNVENSSSDSYEDLRGRVRALDARLHALGALGRRSPEARVALEEAAGIADTLQTDLHIAGRNGRYYGTRWLLGHGYVNAWRRLHEAEDLLLLVEDPDVALGILESEPGLAPLAKEIHPARGFPSRGQFVSKHGPARVSQRLTQLHTTENDSWDNIVNLRNRLFLTLVLAVTLTYAIVVLTILREVSVATMTAGVAFFLVGAAVGVFNELYITSRPSRKGAVFDYGLGHIRLLVTPVLSGLAGIGGVLITTMAGPFLVQTGGGATTPALTSVFNLNTYGIGLVVAAIFGLTPGLLLTRLRQRTDAYKQEIEQSAPASSATRAIRQQAPPIAVG